MLRPIVLGWILYIEIGLFLQATMQFSFYYIKFPQCINMLITTFLTIFWKIFRPISLTMSEDSSNVFSEGHTNVSENCTKFCRDYRRLPRKIWIGIDHTPTVKRSKIILKMLSRMFGYKWYRHRWDSISTVFLQIGTPLNFIIRSSNLFVLTLYRKFL